MSTFKAKIISNGRYEEYKRLLLFASLITTVGFTVFSELFPFGSFSAILVLTATAVIAFQAFKMQRAMNEMLSQHRIEISPTYIRVTASEKKVVHEIDPSEAKAITVDREYRYSEDSAIELWNLVRKKQFANQLTVKTPSEKYNFRFLIESHYMARQIEKIIDGWKNESFPIETSPS